MGRVTHTWYREFAQRCNIPLTDSNLDFFHCWQQAEGGSAAHNPWNSTEPWPGASDYNSVHVKNYASREDGVNATVKIIHQENFAPLLRALQQHKNPYTIADVLGTVPWGTSPKLVKQLLREHGVPRK